MNRYHRRLFYLTVFQGQSDAERQVQLRERARRLIAEARMGATVNPSQINDENPTDHPRSIDDRQQTDNSPRRSVTPSTPSTPGDRSSMKVSQLLPLSWSIPNSVDSLELKFLHFSPSTMEMAMVTATAMETSRPTFPGPLTGRRSRPCILSRKLWIEFHPRTLVRMVAYIRHAG